MDDVGKLLWAPTSYIVFVLVHLYLGLLENILPCAFHQHWRFLYIARRHFIVMPRWAEPRRHTVVVGVCVCVCVCVCVYVFRARFSATAKN